MRSFHENGRIAQEVFYSANADSLCLTYFDTLSNVRAKAYFKNGAIDRADFFNSSGRKASVIFQNNDSLNFSSGYSYEGLFDLADASFSPLRKIYAYWAKRTSLSYPDGPTVLFKNQQKSAEGMLIGGSKSGLWKYYDSKGKLAVTMLYKDTLVPNPPYSPSPRTVGIRTEYDSLGNIRNQSNFIDFEKDYSCFEDNYIEHYQLFYSTYNYLPVQGTSYAVTNTYPDGTPMSSGTLIDGKPHGLWKMYRFDGSLYKMGVYDHGQKTGRWLQGDLSKLHFMGETCLDADSKDFKQMLTEIDVEVEFYEDGNRLSYDYYHYRSPGLE